MSFILWRIFVCDWVMSFGIESPSSHPGFHDCDIGWLVSNVTTRVFMVMVEVGVWLMSQTGVNRDDVTWFVSDVQTPQTEESCDRLWIHWRDKEKISPTEKLQGYWIYWKSIPKWLCHAKISRASGSVLNLLLLMEELSPTRKSTNFWSTVNLLSRYREIFQCVLRRPLQDT